MTRQVQALDAVFIEIRVQQLETASQQGARELGQLERLAKPLFRRQPAKRLDT